MSNTVTNHSSGNGVAGSNAQVAAKSPKSIILVNSVEGQRVLEDLFHLLFTHDAQGCLLTVITEVHDNGEQFGMDANELEECTFQLLKLSQVFHNMGRHMAEPSVDVVQESSAHSILKTLVNEQDAQRSGRPNFQSLVEAWDAAFVYFGLQPVKGGAQ